MPGSAPDGRAQDLPACALCARVPGGSAPACRRALGFSATPVLPDAGTQAARLQRSDMKIAAYHVTPIAIADPPLRAASGLHAPYALRTIVELVAEDGTVGISETHGGTAMVED